MKIARRAEGGQALVEFALVLPVLLLVILGILDLARAVSQENTLAFAAREGTRYAIVHGSNGSPAISCPSPGPGASSCANAAVTDVVTRNAIGVPNITVILGYPDGKNDRNSRVSVDATAPFVPLPSQYLLNGALTVTLRGGSMLVIQR
ncbi:MAG TPA: hypothetical protein DCK98_15475 [Chloroflexi bacterium]|jgi:hypothetical protein|nr:hypothetical protein [Chloroflexota bacterium]HAL28575.1 hypothetical protein [Chloroflexota bacterium]